MKLFHISDLHIGKQLHGYSLIEDQKAILEQIVERIQEEKPQVLVIAGDVYDRAVPSAEAVEVLDDFLTALSRIDFLETFLISGNHDNDRRLDFGGRMLKNCHIHIASIAPRVEHDRIVCETVSDAYGEANLYLMPFLKPSYVKNLYPKEEVETYEDAVRVVIEKAGIDRTKRNLLVAHQLFMGRGTQVEESDSETFRIGGQDSVDVGVLEDYFDYVALGHLHAPQKAGQAYYRYSGSPLKYSISEEHQKKGITCVEWREKGAVSFTQIPLIPKRDVRTMRGLLSEVLAQAGDGSCEDYVAVTLLDEEELYEPGLSLKAAYPNLLTWKVDNTRTRHEMSMMEEIVTLESPMEAFTEFYKKMQGTDATEEEIAVIQRVIEKVEEQ